MPRPLHILCPPRFIFVTINLLMLMMGMQCMLSAQSQPVLIGYKPDSIGSAQRISEIRSLSNDLFKPYSFTDSKGIEVHYRLFRPDKLAAGSTTFPLVVVFHGSGQIGTDNAAQLGLLPKLFANAEIQRTYPAYVLAPQFSTRSSDYSMDSSRHVLASAPRSCLNTALTLIDSLIRYLPIDRNRIYVVGYSMGASTTINALSARPNFFAAGISIAGIPQFDRGREIMHVPLWLIHGLKDDVNTIDSDIRFFNEFNRRNLLFWQLQNTNHDILTSPALLGTALPDWLFKQKRVL